MIMKDKKIIKKKMITAVKSLVRKYETATEGKLLIRTVGWETSDRNIYIDFGNLKKKYSGFGNYRTCSLCKLNLIREADPPDCEGCIYGISKITYGMYHCAACSNGTHQKTYFAIEDAITIPSLVKAYKARAKHIRNIMKRNYGITW